MADTASRKPPPLRAAIVYDFDGTLARGNLQERSFIPDIAGMKHADFWMEVKRLAKAEDADEILVYMHMMLDRARAAGHPVTRKQLQQTGANPDFFDGLDHLAFVLALLDLVVAAFFTVVVLAGVAFFVVVAFFAVGVLAGTAFLAVVVFFAAAVGLAGAAGAGAGVVAGRAAPRAMPVRALAATGAPASGDGAWA